MPDLIQPHTLFGETLYRKVRATGVVKQFLAIEMLQDRQLSWLVETLSFEKGANLGAKLLRGGKRL